MDEQITEEYRDWLSTWASERTTDARAKVARKMLADLQGVENVTTDSLQRWLSGAHARKPWSRWTRATYYSHLTCFCAWLVTAGYLTSNPMPGVRSTKRPNHSPRPLTEAEIARVLAVATDERRDWFLLALHVGLRVHEIAKLRGEDVSDTHVYVDGKGGTRASIPAHADVRAMRDRYPARGHWFPGDDDGHIRPAYISLEIGKLFREVGIATGSIHRARHSYATRMLRGGANLRQVQRLMRHASVATTEAYTLVEDDELVDVIDRLPGA